MAQLLLDGWIAQSLLTGWAVLGGGFEMAAIYLSARILARRMNSRALIERRLRESR